LKSSRERKKIGRSLELRGKSSFIFIRIRSGRALTYREGRKDTIQREREKEGQEKGLRIVEFTIVGKKSFRKCWGEEGSGWGKMVSWGGRGAGPFS